MKTVKEVSALAGISIRTLRYYDEIGLLNPSMVTDAGYRLYDHEALSRLQQIMFFKELELPLSDIKQLLENPSYDRTDILKMQKFMLEKKRNRLNGIIQLIDDMMKGVNTMSFEAFNEDEIRKILDHTLSRMPKESLAGEIERFGSLEKYREHLALGLQNEQAVADVVKWYGGKENAIKAVLQATTDKKEQEQEKQDGEDIYRLFMQAKNAQDNALEKLAVEKLESLYKALFMLDNARAILLDLAKEYLQEGKLAEATDNQFGKGCSDFVAHSIYRYYGV